MRFVSIALLLLLLVPSAAVADCRAGTTNKHVALLGTTDDPDVFVWDSRFRLRDYEGGTFDQMQALLPHAVLVRAGTRATIESCVPNFVLPKYEEKPEDAIGVVLTSGPLRGQRGWVLSSVVHVVVPPPRQWKFNRSKAR